MLTQLRQFSALDGDEKMVFVQAWFLLGWIRAAMLTVPFKRLATELEHHRGVAEPIVLTRKQLEQATAIGKLVSRAARYTPWKSLCLAQVLVVQRLLARRHIAGQFYLGVRKDTDRDAEPTGLSAHAWLQCDNCIVSGAAGHQQFTVVTTFSWGRE